MTTLSLYRRAKMGDRWKYQRILASARNSSTAFFSGMRFVFVAFSNSATVRPLAFAENAAPRWSASSRACAKVSAESVFQNCLPSKKGLA